jgi:signal transduction histidine kinase/FixJ family two-component response regulator
MNKSIENNIRLNVVLIYIFIVIICVVASFAIYKFRDNIEEQKKNIEQFYSEFSNTNELVNLVNQAQSEANLFVATKDSSYLIMFSNSICIIEKLADSLFVNKNDSIDNYNYILDEIVMLLKAKENIAIELNHQFNNCNPFNGVINQIKSMDPFANSNFIVNETLSDTAININYKKDKFWKRVANVFAPDNAIDTVVTITNSKTDSISTVHAEIMPIIEEFKNISDRVTNEYVGIIYEIQRNVGDLIISDQEISSKISGLLIDLHDQITNSRINEIKKSEKFLETSRRYSLVIIIITLTLILALIILIIYNVNKSAKVKMTLEKSNEQIKQIMESRHELLLSVSHDIKTPLNSILGYLGLKQKSVEISENDILSMQNSGKHILALLENLLEFSSLEQDKLEIYINNFNLLNICNEVVDLFMPLAEKKDLDFKHKFDIDKNLVISADELKIRQIVINLISNSIKYTTRGYISLNICYTNKNIEIEIIDTGVGMSQEHVDYIFEAFYRAKENNAIAGGSGFGMYVVKGLIDLMGGDIKIVSEVNRGTKIRVVIPVATVSSKKSLNHDNKIKKVLIIDDDVVFLRIIKDMFSQLNYRVEICNNIDEFDEKISLLNDIDLIITDMEMGGISGKDILAKTRKFNKNIPVVIMTAQGDFSNNLANELGFDDFLRKPVSINSIKSLLGEPISATNDFEAIEEMFGDDKEAIKEIMEIFINSTEENIELLRKYVSDSNFSKVQYLCHKMLPMFMQIGGEAPVEILKKINFMRSEIFDSNYNWKKDIEEQIEKTKVFIEKIKGKYFVG